MDGLAIPQQHHEGRLKGIFDVGLVAQHPPAGRAHHRPMPANDGLEGRRIATRQKGREQVAIGRFAGPMSEMPENPIDLCRGHANPLDE